MSRMYNNECIHYQAAKREKASATLGGLGVAAYEQRGCYKCPLGLDTACKSYEPIERMPKGDGRE